MPSSSSLLSLAAAVGAVNAAYQGFNYGSTFTDGTVKAQHDFEAEFTNAAKLAGTNGAFTSARLYTMIQGGTPNTPISAIPAAIKTKTSLLFGLWASAGDAAFANEVAALHNTINQYCGQLDGLVAGISVGSEDLYRITPTGVASNAGPGAQPGTLVGYIQQVRDAIKGSCLEGTPVGHVDTWNAYVDGSNQPVIDACDFLGMDTYPYYEGTDPSGNGIENGLKLYQAALDKVQAVGGGKEVWITETGWPVSGPKSGDAVASIKNAQSYWQQVGCPSFGKVNMWWFTMQDAAPATPDPSFGVIGSDLTTTPLFDLSCKAVKPTQSSSSSSSSTSAASSTSTASTASGFHTSTSAKPTKHASSTSAASRTASSGSSSSEAPVPTGSTTGSSPAATGTGSSSDSSSGSGSGSDSSSGSGSGSDSSSGSGSGSSSGSAASPSPTAPLQAGGARTSSLSAAAVALLMAAIAL